MLVENLGNQSGEGNAKHLPPALNPDGICVIVNIRETGLYAGCRLLQANERLIIGYFMLEASFPHKVHYPAC